MASVAGLAPARVGLKIRLRELLCIHGRKNGVMEFWSFGVLFSTTPPLHYSVLFLMRVLYVSNGRRVAMTDATRASTRSCIIRSMFL